MEAIINAGRLLVSGLVLLALGAVCAFADDGDESNVALSWDKAQVYLPGSGSTVTPDKVKVAKPAPVVIYLHGCAGLNTESTSWGEHLSALGYIVVQPDSFARRSESNCDTKLKKFGLFPKAHTMRQQEIRFALDAVRKSPWADANNIFLMGFSEGGTAAARTKLDGFRGIIITGWRCTNTKNPNFDGIFAPKETPVLTVEWSKDDWQNDATKGSCSDKFGDRPKATQLLLPGNGHPVFDQVTAREAVARFIKENLKP
jgi:dienelactone hydrolase